MLILFNNDRCLIFINVTYLSILIKILLFLQKLIKTIVDGSLQKYLENFAQHYTTYVLLLSLLHLRNRKREKIRRYMKI